MKCTFFGFFLGVIFLVTWDTSLASDRLQPKTENHLTKSNLNGFKFSGPCHTIQQKMTGGETSIECDHWRLQISKGQLFMNDLHYGPVKKGDQIQLTPEGGLSINRHPIFLSSEE